MKIGIIKIGGYSPVDFVQLERFFNKSSIIEYRKENYSEISPDFLNQGELCVSDNQLDEIPIRNNAGFTVGIINRPLDGYYFSRLIRDNFIVISTHQFKSLDNEDNVSIEHMIIRFIFGFALIYEAFGCLDDRGAELMQIDTTGCLLDMSMEKSQTFVFFKNPSIGIGTRNRLRSMNINQAFLQKLEKEIQRLKISKYQLLTNWMKRNPAKSAFGIFILSFIMHDLVGNIIYELIFPK